MEERLASVERTCSQALSEQKKKEYIHLHQTLLANQTSMQAPTEALRTEMYNWIRQMVTNVNAPVTRQVIPQPMGDMTNDQTQRNLESLAVEL